MRRRGQAPSSLIVVAPVLQGHEQNLEDAIAHLPEGDGSPFARIDWTHFARMSLIPALLDGDGEPAGPPQAYLLFGADFDGSVARWSAAVADRIGAELDGVLRHCEGYPGTSDPPAFLGYLREYRVPVGFSIVSYKATVKTIRESLELRRRLRDFAVESQHLYPNQLRSAWKQRVQRVPQ